tara:strand:- start:12437 stop:12553 length:117 start_codon:yes stop_codon:yes gene_type:complete
MFEITEVPAPLGEQRQVLIDRTQARWGWRIQVPDWELV